MTSSPRIATATSSPSTVMVGPGGSVPEAIRGSSQRAATASGSCTSTPWRSIHQVIARYIAPGVEVAQPQPPRRHRGTCSTCPIRTCRRRRRRPRSRGRGALLTRRQAYRWVTQSLASREVSRCSARSSSTTSSTRPVSRPGSWSMRTSSMLTSLSPASANSRASSPGWSGSETKTDAGRAHRARRACPGSPGCPPRPRRAPPPAPPGRPSPTAAMTASRLVAHLGEEGEHLVGVGGDDLAVEHRVAAGHPGDVADALAGQGQVVGRRVGEAAGDQGGEQVRHVRGPGDGGVVLDRAQPDRYGAAEPGERLDQRRPRPGRTSSCGVTAQGRPSNSAAAGGQRPGALAAGHRVAADVALDAGRAVEHGRQRAGLHAADVGDHGVRAARARPGSPRPGGPAAPRRRPAAAGRSAATGAAGAQAGGGADVVRVVVGQAAPRARPGAAPGRSTCRAGPCRRSRPGREVTHRELSGSGSGRCAARRRRAGRRA